MKKFLYKKTANRYLTNGELQMTWSLKKVGRLKLGLKIGKVTTGGLPGYRFACCAGCFGLNLNRALEVESGQ